MTESVQTLRTALTYLRVAYAEEPQDTVGIEKRLDLLETRFGFWYTVGGLECIPCWRAGKRGVVYTQEATAAKHASEHQAVAA